MTKGGRAERRQYLRSVTLYVRSHRLGAQSTDFVHRFNPHLPTLAVGCGGWWDVARARGPLEPLRRRHAVAVLQARLALVQRPAHVALRARVPPPRAG